MLSHERESKSFQTLAVSFFLGKSWLRNRYHIFDEKADRDIPGVHESLENIRKAIERDEFVLY